MKKVASLLSRPVDSAAPKLLARLRRAANKAAGRMANSDDTEALHDFRVRLRQLRTWLRICRPHLGKRIPKKTARRLAELMEMTSAGRDGQVHRQWVQKLLARRRLLRRERAGLQILLQELDAQVEQPEKLQHEGLRQFPPIADALRVLSKARVTARRKKRGSQTTLGAVIGTEVQALAEKLQGQLKSITAVEDQEALHQARLTTKRLRYLLEPLSRQVTGAVVFARQLAGLQNLLGDLHDLQTLETRLATCAEQMGSQWARQVIRTGAKDSAQKTTRKAVPPVAGCRDLAAAGRLLREQQRQRFEVLRKRWLGAAPDEIFEGIGRVAARLTGPQQVPLAAGLPTVSRPVAITVAAEAGAAPGPTVVARSVPERR